MNLLGPCLNPAKPTIQLLGVPHPDLLIPIAETLRALRVERALDVHGSGLDEIAVHAFTRAVRLVDGELETVEITPEQAGLPRFDLESIGGGEPAENAQLLTDILDGRGSDAQRSIVAINAGALLEIAGVADDLRDGVERAFDAISTGSARRLLDDFIEGSRG
jgi:anthranilate phosphoribosyltransferase